jgi:hypothetical protein
MSEPEVTQYTIRRKAPDPTGLSDIRVERTRWPDRPGPYPASSRCWAIRCAGRRLNRDGEWAWEPQPSERDATFVRDHSFTLGAALAMAERVEPAIEVPT